MESYGWMMSYVRSWGFSSCNRWASSQGNQMRYKHLEVEGLLFYGKKARSRQVFFPTPFSIQVRNIGSTQIISTLGILFPFHLQLAMTGSLSEVGKKKMPAALDLRQGRFSSSFIPSYINLTGGYFPDHNDWNNNTVIHFLKDIFSYILKCREVSCNVISR